MNTTTPTLATAPTTSFHDDEVAGSTFVVGMDDDDNSFCVSLSSSDTSVSSSEQLLEHVKLESSSSPSESKGISIFDTDAEIDN